MNEINSILMLLIVLAVWEVVKSMFISVQIKRTITSLEKDLGYYRGGYDRLAKGIQSLTDDNFNLINERNNLLKIVEELTPKEKVVKADKPFPDPMYLRKKPKAKKV